MIIAVDFDGVIVEDKFPEIGKVDQHMVDACKRAASRGHELVLWTSRVGHKLQEAVDKCNELGLEFVAVNSRAPSNEKEFSTNPRKIFAHAYIDDRAVGYKRIGAIEFLNTVKEDVR